MRPFSGNISDKIRPYSKIRHDTIVDINLDILKIWKISLSPTADFLKISASEKTCHWILIDETNFWQYIRQIKALIKVRLDTIVDINLDTLKI